MTASKWTIRIGSLMIQHESYHDSGRSIETNVSDSFIQKIQDRTNDMNKDIDMFVSSRNLKTPDEKDKLA